MRVTNSMLVNNLMRNLHTNLSSMSKLQDQLATGRKFAHISDDPVALVYSQAARNKLARLAHYQGAVGSAGDWLNQAEVGVMELQKTIVNAYEAAVDSATNVKTPEDLQNLAKTAAQFRDHYLDTLNTTFGDKFVFGGYNTPGDPSVTLNDKSIKAFTYEIDSTTGRRQLFYNGLNLSQFDGMLLTDYNNLNAGDPLPGGGTLSQRDFDAYSILKEDILTFDVGPGISMPVTMNGIELALFVTTDENGVSIIRDTYTVLDELYRATEGVDVATADDISAMIKPLQDAQNHLLTKTAEIGGRSRRLELLEARYEQDFINYSRMKSDAEDVDMAEVIMNQKMAEAVLQAAMSAGARIIQPTLMDFLR